MYLLRRFALRLGSGVLLLALLSLLIYVGVGLLSGDPVTSRLGPTTPPARIEEIRHVLGLDRPLLVRYAEWVAGLLHGDLGMSATGRSVSDMLSDRFANSVTLAGSALLVMAPLSLVLGVWAAHRNGRFADRAVSVAALSMLSVPEFAIAGVLVLAFAVGLGVLPAVSIIGEGVFPWSQPGLMILPVVSLLLGGLAYSVRVIRAAAIGALAAGHVESMRLAGMTERTVLRRGVLPAILPVAVQVWLVTGVASVGGAVLVEKVFGYPGIGEVVVTAVQTGDLPVVQATVLVLGAAMLVALLLADLAVALGTPRLRTGAVS